MGFAFFFIIFAFRPVCKPISWVHYLVFAWLGAFAIEVLFSYLQVRSTDQLKEWSTD